MEVEAPPTTPVRHTTSVFWRYWAATTTSGVGSAITGVALPLTAVSMVHATSFQVGLLTACGYVGWLVLTLPAGAIASHVPLRGLQASVDLVRGVAILVPPVAYLTGSLRLVHLFVAALMVSLANVFAFVANTTYIPSVVPREQLASRNALVSGTEAVTQLGGPSIAGVLVQAIGAPVTLLFDAVSYLGSGVLMWTLPRADQPSGPRRPMREQIAEGWRFVIRHPLMRPLMLDATATNFVCGALLALTPLYLVRDLAASASQYGLLVATEGVGALLGAVLATRLQRALGQARTLFVAAVMSSLMLLLMPAAAGNTGKILFAITNAGFALGTVVLSILTRTYRQQASPPLMLARVMATVRFVSWSAIPVGSLVAGLLAQGFGARAALWVFAIASIASPAVLFASPIRAQALGAASADELIADA